MNARILLLEDDPSLGQTLEERLIQDGYRVFRATSLSEAREFSKHQFADVFLFDVGLPDGTGFDLLAELRKQGHHEPVLFLTARSDAEDRLRGYELGAEEYIPKPFLYKELALRLRHVLSNHVESILPKEFGTYRIEWDLYKVISNSTHEETLLSPRDCAVLKALVKASPRVLTRDEILDEVVGLDSSPSHRTIDNSIVRLRQVFKDDLLERIRSVRGVGYQFVNDAASKKE